MLKQITVIEGDGIGPEVTRQAIKALDAIALQYNHQFRYTHCLMGACAIDAFGTPLPEATLQSCLQTDAVLLGAIGHPKYDHDPSAAIRPEQGLLQLRKSLGLYANIRPVRVDAELAHLSPIKKERLGDIDFIIFRELTGGIYFGAKETNVRNTRASDTCSYTKAEILCIAHPAFQYARQRRKKLTLVDKANVLATSRLWRSVVQEVAREYEDIEVDYMYVDNAAMQLMLHPQQFDILLTENMFGDILSDEASILSGSLGLLPSASIGTATALFEPIHGSYPQAAGADIANPVGSILSAALMLDHFNLKEEAVALRHAVQWSIQNGYVSQDLQASKSYPTSVIGSLIADYILHPKISAYHNNNRTLGQSTII